MSRLIPSVKLTFVFLLILTAHSCKIVCDCVECPPVHPKALLQFDTASLGITGQDLDMVSLQWYNDSGTMLLELTRYPEFDAATQNYVLRFEDISVGTDNYRDHYFIVRQKQGKFKVRLENLDASLSLKGKAPKKKLFHKNTCDCRCPEMSFTSIDIDSSTVTQLPYVIN